jgi:hypothetical protein
MILVPEQKIVSPQQKIIVNILVDSAGRGFNVAQATIRFPKNLMLASEPDKTDSAFSFWLEQPTASNEQGVISFIGGTPYGVSGGSIQILRLEFTPKGVGDGLISIVDAAITASDGSGANIMSTTTDTVITVSANKTVTTNVATSSTAVSVPVPVVSSGLPSLPRVNLPLYPDSTLWYNSISPFTVSWTLPSDVSGVNTAINRQQNFIPNEESKGLFNNEKFNPLTDGIWYLHIRFKNNIGWGPTLHRRIAIDTVPPVGFVPKQIDIKDKSLPRATFQFKATDALSGLKGYMFQIDGVEKELISAINFTGKATTPVLTPGEHNIQVGAVDLAGNTVISTSTIVKIEPISPPTITYISDRIYTSDNIKLTLKGLATPGNIIQFKLLHGKMTMEQGTTTVNSKGEWTYISKDPLPAGTFIVHIRSEDSKGALSEEVLSSAFTVEDKPVVQLGSFHLDFKGTVTVLLTIIVAGISGGWWLYRKREEKLFMRLLNTENDMMKVFSMINADLEKTNSKNMTESDIKLINKRLNENIKKMENYLKSEIQQINK